MIDCRDLSTRECLDPVVATGFRGENYSDPYYMSLPGPQYLQIFRTTVVTNADELADGSWLKGLEAGLERHLHQISQCCNLSFGQIVEAEGGPYRPLYRTMHGLHSFEQHDGFDDNWRPGLLYLRGRLIRVMKPFAPLDHTTGGEMKYVREVPWVSEVALGFRKHNSDRWKPATITDEAESWLREAERWDGKDFP